MRRARWLLPLVPTALLACRDTSGFTTKPGEHYEGAVVGGSFVRSGVGADVRMCLVLDSHRLQDLPGSLTSSDGMLRDTILRPIPQLWHDPLSTLTFGDGRVQNLVYVVTPTEDGGAGQDVNVVVSLMQSGSVEVRLFRGAPGAAAPQATPLFAVFDLKKQEGPCPL